MSTDIGIRPATIQDHDAINRIAREINVMHVEALPDRFRFASDALPRDYIYALIESDDSTVMVAERHGDIVGYAILHIKESSPIPVAAPRRYVVLNDLVVTEADRNYGIGRLLVEATIDWTREQGVYEIELGVFEFNDSAIAFYEHLGFHTVKRTMSLLTEPS